MVFGLKHYGSVGVAFVLMSVEFFLILDMDLRVFVMVLTLILSLLPLLVSFIVAERSQNEKDTRFLEFSRDLVENAKSGTPIVKGILNLQNRDYGTLSSHVKKLASQLTLGIPLTQALQTFARETKSRVISRSVTLISEAQTAGGRIETILESVASSVNQIDTLKKERKSSVSNLITQGYIIFVVFIVIMLIMEFSILPMLDGIGGGDTSIGSLSPGGVEDDDLTRPLFVLLLTQSFFAGLVIGKISEGSIKSGIRHSFILLTLTLLVTTGARVLFG
jgi:flagellar protein FlaJ